MIDLCAHAMASRPASGGMMSWRHVNGLGFAVAAATHLRGAVPKPYTKPRPTDPKRPMLGST